MTNGLPSEHYRTGPEQDAVERVARAIWEERDGSLTWHDAKRYAKNPHNERVVLGVRAAYTDARTVLEAALGTYADPPGYSDDAGNSPDAPGGY